ncbi:MAG: cell division protein FtsW [Alphaproteobacteria bacterium]|nr:cell division protein FtsW [Alphaproteobacteria bacterium]
MTAIRARRFDLSYWWMSLDRPILGAVLILAAAGLVLSLAASPAVARTHGFGEYHFVIRQIVFLLPSLALIVALTLLDVAQVRRAAIALLGLAAFGLALCPAIGPEVNGAQRWLSFGALSLQPSEFMKPAFVVAAAALIARGHEHPRFPGLCLAFLVYLALLALLLAQPDFGQAVLLTLAWATLFFLAGTPIGWSLALAGAAGFGALGAYVALPHVASRIDRFLDPASGDTFQVDQSLRAFMHGGFAGQGPGEGAVKDVLPDAHTDFVFAVAGEEFGLFACLAITALFAVVVLRGLERALAAREVFVQLSVAGLVVLFGGQALINMGVNLRLLPAKGMTLPFISYGGSSLLALAVTVGFILALTRRRAAAPFEGEGP